MNYLRKTLKLFIQLLILGGGAIILILAFSRLVDFQPIQIKPIALQPGYPPPSFATSTPTQSGYPGPQLAQVTPSPINTTNSPKTTTKVAATATPDSSIILEPWMATNAAFKAAYTPSAADIAVAATFTAKFKAIPESTPPVIPTGVRIPFKTIDDLPNVVYNDPGFSFEGDAGDCIQGRKTGSAAFVKFLDQYFPDYYLLPFFKGEQICGIAMIFVKDGSGSFGGFMYGDNMGSKFPYIDTNEAIQQVEEKYGTKILGSPILVAGGYQELHDLFNPAWQITTAESQFFVLSSYPQNVQNNLKTTVTIFSPVDMHKIP